MIAINIDMAIYTCASRIPTAQHEGSMFVAFLIFVCVFVSMRKMAKKKNKAT